MIKLEFEKLYSRERIMQPVTAAIPLKKGLLANDKCLLLKDENGAVAYQSKVTGYWDDGSVKWLFLRFLADLPANAGKDYYLDLTGGAPDSGVIAKETNDGIEMDTGALYLKLTTGKKFIKPVTANGVKYTSDAFDGPCLSDKDGNRGGN